MSDSRHLSEPFIHERKIVWRRGQRQLIGRLPAPIDTADHGNTGAALAAFFPMKRQLSSTGEWRRILHQQLAELLLR